MHAQTVDTRPYSPIFRMGSDISNWPELGLGMRLVLATRPSLGTVAQSGSLYVCWLHLLFYGPCVAYDQFILAVRCCYVW